MNRIKFSLSVAAGLLAVVCQASAQQQVPNYTSSWFGNTFNAVGSTLPTRLNNVQMGFDAIGAGPDGTVFTEVGWDESHVEMGYYKDGQSLGQWRENGPGGGPGGNWALNQWDFNNADGGAVAANDDYVFLTIDRTINTRTQGPGWFRCESRKTNRPVGFDIQASTQRIEGLALNGNNLYVSDKANGLIKIYDISDVNKIALSSSFPVVNSSPGRLTIDANGNLWVMDTHTSPPNVHKYSSTGADLKTVISFASGVIPTDISYNPITKWLMVADVGPDQNIKFYDPSSIVGSPTTPAGTFGETQGIYSGTSGQRQPLKFADPSGVSADANGNIYIAEGLPGKHSLGASLSSYTPAGVKNWEVDNLIFVDGATADPANENSVYTKNKHFTLDLSKSGGGQEWSYAGHTLDSLTYPQDLRVTKGPFDPMECNILAMRRINGALFMYVSNMYSDYCGVYRFDPVHHGEIAIPCGLIVQQSTKSAWPPNQPVGEEWIWCDADGNGNFDPGEFVVNNDSSTARGAWGWNVDALGNIWLATKTGGIREFPCQGLNAHGGPIYNYATLVTTPMPAPFTSLFRAIYDQPRDTMYLTGYTADFPNTNNAWGKCAGRVAAGYKNWSKGNRIANWTINGMHDSIISHVTGKDCFIASVAVAGDYFFAQWSGPGMDNKGDNQQTEIYDIKNVVNGSPAEVGYMLPPPGASINQAEIDTPWGMQAYQRFNGEYIVYIEDDWFGKILMYRWNPQAAASPTTAAAH